MHKLENRGEWMTQQRGRSSHSPRSLAASAEHGSATAERADTGWFEGTRRHGWWRLGGEARSPDWSWLSAFPPRHGGEAADRFAKLRQRAGYTEKLNGQTPNHQCVTFSRHWHMLRSCVGPLIHGCRPKVVTPHLTGVKRLCELTGRQRVHACPLAVLNPKRTWPLPHRQG